MEAQIQLGLGNFAKPLSLVNQVRTQAGGSNLTPYPATDASGGNAFVQVRKDLMKEQRISTVFGDERRPDDRPSHVPPRGRCGHDVAVYRPGPDSLVAAANGHPTDYHTTISSIPTTGVHGTRRFYTLTCP